MDDEVETLYSLLQTSAAMNYARWDDLKDEFSGKGTYFAGTYREAKDNLKTWLEKREEAFTAERVMQYLNQINIFVNLNRAKMDILLCGCRWI